MMRNLCLSLLFGAVLCGTAAGQEWARKMFETTSHDFGVVPRGADPKFRFDFKNIYKETVHIAGVRTSCGCTTPKVSKDTLETYEKGAIVAQFNTHSFMGRRSATLTVIIDEPYYAEVQLNVVGVIRSDILLKPGKVSFGPVDHGQPAIQHVRLKHYGSQDWQITGFKTDSKFLTAEASRMASPFGDMEYDIKVKLSQQAPVGYLKETITILTNDGTSSSFPLEVEGRIIPEVTVRPASLFLGALRPGQKVTKQVIIKGKRPFKITSIDCEGDCFEFGELPEATKTLHIVPVTFCPSSADIKQGKVTQKILVHTSLGEDMSAEFLAYAQIVGG